MSFERPLRYVTFLATAIAVPLNIAATVISLEYQSQRWARRHVTAFCFAYIPLAITIVTSSLSLQYLRTHGKSPSALRHSILDLVAALAYIGALIPCWALEIREFSAGGFGLLVGYATAPMILNMLIHVFFTLNKISNTNLLSVLGMRGGFCQQQCPNCQTKFVSGATETPTKKGYSLLSGDDYLDVEAGPIQGRTSEESLGEGSKRADQADQTERTRQVDQAKQAEESSQGKDATEV